MIAYSFADYLAALGDDYYADDDALSLLLTHHGLGAGLARDKVARYGVMAARSFAEGVDASDRPDQLPRVVGYGPHGRPDPMGVTLHPATKRLLAAALRAGAAYEPDLRARYAMTYLGAQPGEAGVSCPLACTDGFLRAVDALPCPPEVVAAAEHIRTQAPGGPVHAAQFVTEAQGGSDAATNLVRAVPEEDGSYLLSGNKFFCSNLSAQYWAVTARPDGAPDGARGVALFMVPRALSGEANGWRIERLKDKLGTRSLPTGEITLDGARGWPIGPLEGGLRNMVGLVLTTSRFWTGVAAIGFIRAAERIAHAYAGFREAFGGPIARFPLVADSLDALSRDRRHMLSASFEVLAAWERAEEDEASRWRSRILVSLFKTWATRRATQRVHEAILVLGGNGIEERFSPLPRLLRDAVILETWEGPHGLLLSRGLEEVVRLGADEATVRLLLGEGESQAAKGLSAELARLVDLDSRARMRGFQGWVDALFDHMGASAWAAAQAAQPIPTPESLG